MPKDYGMMTKKAMSGMKEKPMMKGGDMQSASSAIYHKPMKSKHGKSGK